MSDVKGDPDQVNDLKLPFAMTQKELGVGRVNQLLKHGLKHIDRLWIEPEIRRNRWLAGLWYLRIAHHDLPQLDVIRDCLIDKRSLLAKKIYEEVRTVIDYTEPREVETWGLAIAMHKVIGLDVGPNKQSVFWNLIDLAMVDFRLKTPRSRASRRWQETYGGTVQGRNICCAYCKAPLELLPRGNRSDRTVPTNKHTLTCALWFMMNDEKTDRNYVDRGEDRQRRVKRACACGGVPKFSLDGRGMRHHAVDCYIVTPQGGGIDYVEYR